MRPAAFVDFRCISLDPAPDTTGVHWDAAFGHQRGHVFISQGVWEVPTDALHDHLTGKMAAFEGIGGRDRHAPPRYQTPPPNFATEPAYLLQRFSNSADSAGSNGESWCALARATPRSAMIMTRFSQAQFETGVPAGQAMSARSAGV